MTDGEEKPTAYHDNALAIMFRQDVDRIAALRRATSGVTRCPQCDALNPADQKRCNKCGALLYPELEMGKEESEQ